jgi:hypothetical protein
MIPNIISHNQLDPMPQMPEDQHQARKLDAIA